MSDERSGTMNIEELRADMKACCDMLNQVLAKAGADNTFSVTFTHKEPPERPKWTGSLLSPEDVEASIKLLPALEAASPVSIVKDTNFASFEGHAENPTLWYFGNTLAHHNEIDLLHFVSSVCDANGLRTPYKTSLKTWTFPPTYDSPHSHFADTYAEGIKHLIRVLEARRVSND